MNSLTSLTIEFANENKKNLLALGAGDKPVVVDLTQTEAIDLSGIQLLVATLKEAAGKKREIHFAGTLSDSVKKTLMGTGLFEIGCETGEALENSLKAVSQ